MRSREVHGILLVILLVATTRIPIASAAGDENECHNPALDIQNIRLPELQFNRTQPKVSVGSELHLDPDLSASSHFMQGTSAEPFYSTIPYGSIIYHSDDGITTVFEASGRQLFSADDSRTIKIKTPGMDKPVTYVHEVPSGSMILSDPAQSDRTYVIDKDHNLVLTVIDHSKNPKTRQDSISVRTSQNLVQCSSRGRCLGWFEYAEDNYIPQLNRFEAYWATPNRPLTNDIGEKIAIFNSIQPEGNAFILQPVLEWNVNSNNFAWTAAPWYYCSTSDSYYGRRIAGVQPNDIIKGSLYYSNVNGYSGWWVSIRRNNDPESSVFVTELSTTSGLNAEVVLEATGIGINSDDDLPGDLTFYNMIFQRSGGSSASASLSGYVDPEASQSFSGLDAVIEQNPSRVTLWTPN